MTATAAAATGATPCPKATPAARAKRTRMRLEDARGIYEARSTKLSDVVRQLALAGIAVVWVFKVGVAGQDRVPKELVPTAVAMISALAIDALQYAYAAAAWGIFNRVKERSGTQVDQEFTAPPLINWPTLGLFWGKVLVVGLGYVPLLRYLISRTQ